MRFDLIGAVGGGVAEDWKARGADAGERAPRVVIGWHRQNLRDGIGGKGAEGHEAVDGALPLQDGIIQAQFMGEGLLIAGGADPLAKAQGERKFTSLEFRQQMRNGVGAEFLERGIKFDGDAAAVDTILKIEGTFEPLIEGEAIDCGTGVPAREKDPAGSQEKESDQDGDPEAEAGFCIVDCWDAWSLGGVTLRRQ